MMSMKIEGRGRMRTSRQAIGVHARARVTEIYEQPARIRPHSLPGPGFGRHLISAYCGQSL
jgi:hypothetical protein